MTDPLQPPPKKNPLKRSTVPTQPPGLRSRAALGLTAAAAEGRFMLQKCSDCGALQYPARDACSACLGPEIPYVDVPPSGTVLAETTVRTSTNTYFRERMPWRMGTVQLDAGPIIQCHIHGDVATRGRVTIWNRLDRSGQGVLMAVPEERSPNMEDDPILREISCDPKHRRVLITDARNPNAVDLANALTKAGTAMIFVGEAESWLPNPQRAALAKIENLTILPLDVTDTSSVNEISSEIGGKVDILINNARYIRPGGALERGDNGFAKDEMEVNYLGLMRLAQAFGPAMCSRTADGLNSAVAWVNILSVYALSNLPEFGSFSASQAAALSLSQNLRGSFRVSGLRVMNVFTGPTEDEWHQPLPPPKLQPKTLARDVVAALKDGLEDVYSGDVAKDVAERFTHSPKVLEREMTSGDAG